MNIDKSYTPTFVFSLGSEHACYEATKYHTRHNFADSVPTSNLVCIKEVAIRTTSSHITSIAGIIYHTFTCSSVTDIQCTRYKNAFNKRF